MSPICPVSGGLGGVRVMCRWEGVVWEECVTRTYSCSSKSRQGGTGLWNSLLTPQERSSQECLVGMKTVHKQSVGTGRNFSSQAVGWEQLERPDAAGVGVSLRGQPALLGVFGVCYSFKGSWQWGGFRVKSDRWGVLRSYCQASV